MFAANLLLMIAALGTSVIAAPISNSTTFGLDDGVLPFDSEFAPHNSTLYRRLAAQPPAASKMTYWATMGGALVGTLPQGEWHATTPFDDCKVIEYGGDHEYKGRSGLDAKVICRRWSKQLIYDIRRIGDATNCRTSPVTEKWTLSESQTEQLSMKVGLSAPFKMFTGSMELSASDSRTKSSSYEKTVTCGKNFEGIKCHIGGRALIEVGYFMGWVTIPRGDPVNTWIDQTNEWPYGMRAPYEDTKEWAWNGGYETGWYDWEAEGEQACRDDIDDRHYVAKGEKLA